MDRKRGNEDERRNVKRSKSETYNGHNYFKYSQIPTISKVHPNPLSVMDELNIHVNKTFALDMTDNNYVIGKSYYVSPDMLKQQSSFFLKTVIFKIKRVVIIETAKYADVSKVEGELSYNEISEKKFDHFTSKDLQLTIIKKPVFDAVVVDIKDKVMPYRYFIFNHKNDSIGTPVSSLLNVKLATLPQIENALQRDKLGFFGFYSIYRSNLYYRHSLTQFNVKKIDKSTLLTFKTWSELIIYLVKNGAELADEPISITDNWPSRELLLDLKKYIPIEI